MYVLKSVEFLISGTIITDFFFFKLKADGLLVCACKAVYYCDKVCQKNAWKSHHKLECEYFRRIPNEFANVTDSFVKDMFRKGVATLMLRSILKLSQGGQDEFVLPNDKKRRFSDLMSHKQRCKVFVARTFLNFSSALLALEDLILLRVIQKFRIISKSSFFWIYQLSFGCIYHVLI